MKVLYRPEDLSGYQDGLIHRYYRWWTCGVWWTRGCDISVKLGPISLVYMLAEWDWTFEVHWLGRHGWYL